MKPWNYKRWGFDYIHALVDGTTKRFNDNSKLVVVDGPPALGKTEVAKALAEEFDMKFVPGWTMENFYVNRCESKFINVEPFSTIIKIICMVYSATVLTCGSWTTSSPTKGT